MRYDFRGDAAERGRQHGRALREQIRTRIAHALPAPPEHRAELARPWLAAIDRIEDRAPLGAELRGIAGGAGVALHDVVLLNAFEAFEVARQVELGGCTSVAVAGPAGAVVAQNWDANPSLSRSVAVHVHSGPDIPATVLVASPGGLGWIGMNASGVALVNNDLLTPGVRPGIPSQAVRRLALARDTARDAVAEILAAPAVGGRAYLVADATGAVTTVELAAEADPSVTYHRDGTVHTNHALAREIGGYEDRGLLASTYPSSRSRLRRASELLGGRGGAEPEQVCRGVLADHAGYPLSICRHPSAREPTVTAASVVFDCGRRRASVYLGNPCAAAPFEIALPAT